MKDKTLEDILKSMKHRNDITIVGDMVSFVNNDQRYTQRFLDASEGIGFIECKSKGTM